MSLSRTDVTQCTVSMLDVVPMDETRRPVSCSIQIAESNDWKLRAVFGRAEQYFDKGVVVAHDRMCRPGKPKDTTPLRNRLLTSCRLLKQ